MKTNFATAFLCTAVLAATAASAADDPIANRQAIMKNFGAASGVLSAMSKGEAEFDAQSAVLAVRVINAGSMGLGALFPDGSQTGGETRALPKIWEDMGDFEAKVAKLQEDTGAAIAAPPASKEDLTAMLETISSNCGSCHETYRAPKN